MIWIAIGCDAAPTACSLAGKNGVAKLWGLIGLIMGYSTVG